MSLPEFMRPTWVRIIVTVVLLICVPLIVIWALGCGFNPHGSMCHADIDDYLLIIPTGLAIPIYILGEFLQEKIASNTIVSLSILLAAIIAWMYVCSLLIVQSYKIIHSRVRSVFLSMLLPHIILSGLLYVILRSL